MSGNCLQVGLTNDRPVILLGKEIWGGLLTWMRGRCCSHDYISPADFRWITLVDTAEEVIDLLTVAHEHFMRSQIEGGQAEEAVDRTVTAEVLSAAPPADGAHRGRSRRERRRIMKLLSLDNNDANLMTDYGISTAGLSPVPAVRRRTGPTVLNSLPVPK